MVALIRAADRYLACGDHAAVVALEAHDVLWLHKEVQSLARLALPAKIPRERLRKRWRACSPASPMCG